MNPVDQSPYAVKVRAAEHRLWRDNGPTLRALDIELTERCNNNCIHCWINLPAGDEAARRQELSTAKLQAILKDAADLGALTVRFTGGEPLLRDDFAELYLSARRLGLRVILSTNARRVTPKLADLLARVPPLNPVEVTVYGMSQASYEAVSRVAGSFAEFQRGVRLLLDRQVRLLVRGIHLPQNRQDREALEAWAATMPSMDRSPPEVLSLDLRVRRDDPRKNRQIAELRLAPEETVRAMRQFGEEYARDAISVCAHFMGPLGERLFTCGAGRHVCLDAYGILQPCLGLRHPDTVYDLKSGSLSDALRVFFPRVRCARAANPEYLSRCARCFLHGLCDQCPAKSWTEHGTLDTPVQYHCDVAHAQARDLGLLGENERGWQVDGGQERVERWKQRRRESSRPGLSPSPSRGYAFSGDNVPNPRRTDCQSVLQPNQESIVIAPCSAIELQPRFL